MGQAYLELTTHSYCINNIGYNKLLYSFSGWYNNNVCTPDWFCSIIILILFYNVLVALLYLIQSINFTELLQIVSYTLDVYLMTATIIFAVTLKTPVD